MADTRLSETERNWVGDLSLLYTPGDVLSALVTIEGKGSAVLTMDQADSLVSILRGWVEKSRAAEREADIARRRSEGARSGWEIRRANAGKK